VNLYFKINIYILTNGHCYFAAFLAAYKNAPISLSLPDLYSTAIEKGFSIKRKIVWNSINLKTFLKENQ